MTWKIILTKFWRKSWFWENSKRTLENLLQGITERILEVFPAEFTGATAGDIFDGISVEIINETPRANRDKIFGKTLEEIHENIPKNTSGGIANRTIEEVSKRNPRKKFDGNFYTVYCYAFIVDSVNLNGNRISWRNS